MRDEDTYYFEHSPGYFWKKSPKNMKYYLVNYANKKFRHTQEFSNAIAQTYECFQKIFSYSPKDLDKDFVEKNKNLFKYRRGGGYWVWKPYIILKALNKIKDNDYLFYCDSGAYFLNNPQNLLNLHKETSQDIIIYETKDINKKWVKRDVFVELNCDTSKFTDCNQIDAGYMHIRKTKQSISFIKEWLSLCEQENLIDDSPNRLGKPNYEGFIENRHDQALLTILVTKHNLIRFKNLIKDRNLNMIVRIHYHLPKLFRVTRGFPYIEFSRPVFKKLRGRFIFKCVCNKIITKSLKIIGILLIVLLFI